MYIKLLDVLKNKISSYYTHIVSDPHPHYLCDYDLSVRY